MKKIICVLLTLSLALAAAVSVSAYSLRQNAETAASDKTAAEAIAEYEAETGEKVATRRYYFQMPDGVHGKLNSMGEPNPDWRNEYSDSVYVYWWGDAPAACESWPGYKAAVADQAQHIYYADIPAEVETLIWNNGLTGTSDPDQPAYYLAYQTSSIFTESAEPGDYDTVPEGFDSPDGCICILDEYPDHLAQPPHVLPASWYFYYGDGCYGMYSKDSDHFTGVDENCCNPDHIDKNGNHIGYAAPTPILGDADGDGIVTVLDATRIQRYLADLCDIDGSAFSGKALTVKQKKICDADKDNSVTIMDATAIQRHIADLSKDDGIGDAVMIPDDYELEIIK